MMAEKGKPMKKSEETSRYPFVISILPEDDGGGYLITFPDLPGCMSDGDTIEKAIEMGQDAAWGWLQVARERGQEIPKPGASQNLNE